jgi:hypothetical protein
MLQGSSTRFRCLPYLARDGHNEALLEEKNLVLSFGKLLKEYLLGLFVKSCTEVKLDAAGCNT